MPTQCRGSDESVTRTRDGAYRRINLPLKLLLTFFAAYRLVDLWDRIAAWRRRTPSG
jgi:hypothetical protein